MSVWLGVALFVGGYVIGGYLTARNCIRRVKRLYGIDVTEDGRWR